MEIRVLAPKPAVRAMCADCLGMTQWNRKEVEACQGDEALAGPCTLFPYRMGRRISVKTLRRECLRCQNGQTSLVRECERMDCPLYIYRMGRNELRIGEKSRQNVRGAGFLVPE